MSKRANTAEKPLPPLDDWRSRYASRLREDIADDWSVKSVGEICSIKTGKLDVNQADEGGAYPFFTCAEKIYRINTPAFDTEAVLLAGNGDFNVKYYKGKFNAYQRTYVLSDLQVDGKYLFYYIAYRLQDLTSDSRGSTIKYIRLGDVRDYPVPVAPLDQQNRIVAEIEKQLSRLDEAVANLKRVKANLKRYKAAVLKAAVEGKLTEEWRKAHPDVEPASKLLDRVLAERRAKWEEAELAKMEAKGKTPKNDKWKAKYKEPGKPIEVKPERLPNGWAWASVEQLNPAERPCAYGVLQPGPDVRGGIPLIRVGDIQEGSVRLDEMKRVSPEIAGKYPRTSLKGGEVLISLVGAIGRTAVVPDSLAGANTARAVGVMPLTRHVTPDWVELWFRNPAKITEMTGKAHEVARKTLNLEDVRSAAIALPSGSEQEEIVTVVAGLLSVVSTVETEVDKNMQRSTYLRQSVLAKAFAGDVDGEMRNNKIEPTVGEAAHGD